MSHFILTCHDKPDSLSLRMATRPAHLDYIAANQDKLVMAGPLLADDGETMVGSVLVLDVADRAAAEAFSANDPYAKAGLFGSVTIHGIRAKIYKA
ncbi:YciI family protein [Zavarzinia sp. CC-PAN008]|uniref:YciI family protein n=1 Tax=Zavarzinia sp. CC-PAN008 TaxID=3243332 RepID=UPI003F7473DF